jgi:hypothetical protein
MMAHETSKDRTGGGSITNRIAALDGIRLDAGIMGLAVIGLVGNLIDIRSHDSGVTFEEEGFLTVPHIIFYSAFLAIAGLITAVIVANRLEGKGWLEAIPQGYRLGLVGVFLFGLGGPGDALWHATFSAESGVEALTSPTHLMLATGSVLFLSSPARRAFGFVRQEVRGWRQVPMLMSAAFTFTAITIITLYGHPVYGDQWVIGGSNVSLGVISLIFQAGILAGVVAVLIRRFRLVPGAFTLLLGLNGIAMTWVGESYFLLPGIFLTGVVADVLYFWLRPSPDRERLFRGFLAGVPALYYAVYFVSIFLTDGIGWVVHIWAGSVVLAGFAGLLVSYLALPDKGTLAEIC